MSLTFHWRSATTLPVDGASLKPETFESLSAGDVPRLKLRTGNANAELGELFSIEGTPDDILTLEGDLSHVHGIGQGMSRGTLEIRGPVGAMLGSRMSGGNIVVLGSAGDWLGAEMLGGRIRIRGSVGNFVGAALPGSRSGMTEGLIFVEGTAGDDVGLSMRRGLIAILGDAGQGAGRSMIAGTILLGRNVGGLVGAGMKRGSVVMLNPNLEPNDLLLPTFVRAGQFPANFLILYKRQLEAWGLAIPHSEAVLGAPFERYNGDTVNGGQGEVLLRSRDHDGRKLWEAKVGS